MKDWFSSLYYENIFLNHDGEHHEPPPTFWLLFDTMYMQIVPGFKSYGLLLQSWESLMKDRGTKIHFCGTCTCNYITAQR